MHTFHLSACLQVGGSVVFIVCYWCRRWTGRDKSADKRAAVQHAAASEAAAAAQLGSIKSYYSSDPTGSELEIAIQPGSARFTGGQMHVPQSGEHWGGLPGAAWSHLSRVLCCRVRDDLQRGACSLGLRCLLLLVVRASTHSCTTLASSPCHSAEHMTDESYSPRSDASPSPVRRRRTESPFGKAT